MRTILHISDLHFGREIRAVQEGLVADIEELRPSLVVVSGDLTQRALIRQFLRARRYLNRITPPVIVVPGNHDIPFFDVTRRIFLPLQRYKHYIHREVNPTHTDSDLSIIGLNTARPFTLQNGRISPRQLDLLREHFAGAPPSAARIVVTHHPFVKTPRDARRRTILGAASALESMEECGVDLLLTGHFHHSFTTDVRAFYPSIRRQIIIAQAGTSISRRLKHETNTYNLMTLTPHQIAISIRGWNGEKFEPLQEHSYPRETHDLKDAFAASSAAFPLFAAQEVGKYS